MRRELQKRVDFSTMRRKTLNKTDWRYESLHTHKLFRATVFEIDGDAKCKIKIRYRKSLLRSNNVHDALSLIAEAKVRKFEVLHVLLQRLAL